MNLLPYLGTLFSVGVVVATSAVAFADSPLHGVDDAIATTDYSRAIDLIDIQLATTPEDSALLFQRARYQGYVGDFDAALDTLDTLRRRHPCDVDYAFARAQLLARQGRDREALEELRVATLLAPDYEEVSQLLSTLLLLQKNDSARWAVLIGASHENLSDGLPSWSQRFLEISREKSHWGRYRLGVARDERFGKIDRSVMLGGDISFSRNWSTGVEFVVVNDANFQPGRSYSGYLGRSIRDGWRVNFLYRRREYQSVVVGSAISTVENYFGDFRIAYAIGISRIHGSESYLNHGFSMNWYYNDGTSVGITLNTGTEAEVTSPGQVLEMNVRSVILNGRRRLTDRFGLHWWLGLHDQGDFYRRQYFGMAISIRL